MDRRAAIDRAARTLLSFGIGLELDEARREARLLLEHCLTLSPDHLRSREREPMTSADLARYSGLIERRRRREPVSQIIGQWEFWGLPFIVTPDTLTPRPDSETLVAVALSLIDDFHVPLRLLDLGTGTGCLLLALLHEMPDATGLGIDRNPAALSVAQRNAEALELTASAAFALGDWTEGLTEMFDIILSNPPYIPSADIPGLMPEVSHHEPRMALDGGHDGLDAYRTLASQVPARLVPGGHVLLEVGFGQAPAVSAILAGAGLTPIAVRPDLGGRDRCVIFRKSK